MALKLYTYETSGNCYKARILAALLHIPLQIEHVDILAGEQKQPAYLKINPRGSVPALVDTTRNLTLADSASILTYLAGLGPHGDSSKGPSAYWSADVVEQAQIMDWVMFAATSQAPLARRRYVWSYLIPSRGETPELQKEFEETLEPAYASLELLEKHLQKNLWLAVKRPTTADIANFIYPALAPMGDVKLDKFPYVRAWVERIRSLPNFPDVQGLDDPLFLRRAKGLS